MLAMLTILALHAAPEAEWREFRGPDGTGRYNGPKLVTEWGTDTNVAWKVPVPGKGWSSPILANGKIVLTSAIPGENESQKLHVLAFDAATGKPLWDKMLF